MGDDIRLEKLNATNYRHWSRRAKSILMSKQCWSAIEPGMSETPTNVELRANEKAVGILMTSIDDDALDDVEDCVTAQEIWNGLKETRTQFNSWDGMLAVKECANITKREDETILQYLTRHKQMLFKVRGAGIEFADKQSIIFLLMGLPAEYETFARSFKLDDKTLTMKTFKNQLLEEETRLMSNNINRDIKVMKISGSNTKYANKFEKYERNDTSFRGGYQQKQGRRYTNNGHKQANSDDDKSNQRGSGSNEERGPRCYRCQMFGHIGKYCPKFGDHQNTSNNTRSNSEKSTNLALAMYTEKEDNTNSTINEKHSTFCTIKNASTRNDIWIIDSGATDHITCRRDRFKTFIEQTSSVEVAGGGKLMSYGYGIMRIELSNECGGSTIDFMNTLYVPDLQGNLLSATKITDHGFKINMKKEVLLISDKNDNVRAKAIREGRFYCLRENEPDIQLKPQPSIVNLAKSKELEIWHKRLGHIHIQAVRKQLKTSAVEIELKDTDTNQLCDICIEGKMKSLPFPKTSETRATEPLQRIHSDVMCVMNPVSYGGARYIVTFTDDHTRYTEVYPMKHKSEALEKFKIFKAYAENVHKRKIVELRTDNGREYINTEFDKYLQNEGIRRQLTVAHTPQQNGVAERLNQTLVNMARCILLESGLPLRLWAEAVYCANYLRNRTPTKANQGRSPYIIWKGKPPNLIHLRTFGCRAWKKISEKQSKFKPRGEERIMIGYSEQSKAYRLWNPKNQTVDIARDVIFEEEIFPAKMKKENIESNKYEDTKKWMTLTFNELCSEDNTEAKNENRGEEINNVEEEEERESVSEEQISKETAQLEQPLNQQNFQEIERRRRNIRKPAWMQDYVTECKHVQKEETRPKDPITLQEAIKTNDSEEWKNAIMEEFENLIRNKTWTFVPRTRHIKVIRTKWAFKRKYDENGKLVRHRARVVALGYEQRPGIDFDKTYSPVVKMKTMRILMGIATERNWSVHHVDIVAAYLLADIDSETYIEIPEGFIETSDKIREKFNNIPSEDELRNGKWICKLEKCIYGLHQSGRKWNETLDGFLRKQNMKRSVADPCVYYDNQRELIVTTYVDDLMIYGKLEEINKMKETLGKEYETRDLGDVRHVQSIRVTKTDTGFILDQTAYTEEILKEFHMQDCRPVLTPLATGEKLEAANEENKLDEANASRYRTLIGSILYLATGTRPDLAYPTTYLSQFNHNPSQDHWRAAKHLLRYLKGTKTKGLELKKSEENVKMYTDADWGSDITDRKSYSGFITTFAGAAVNWHSRKQRTIALSTVEAEFVALSEAVREAKWMNNLLEEIGQTKFVERPIVIHIDNQGAKKLAENRTSSERTKHIALKIFFVQDEIEEGNISLQYVPTYENAADCMTKIIEGKKFKGQCGVLGLKD